MKFGLCASIASPPGGEHLDRAIDETIAEAQLAEASGFDSCFFGEHPARDAVHAGVARAEPADPE